MNINPSGYYKWVHRKKNPSLKELRRQADLNLIKEVHRKHPSHGYRWINAYLHNRYSDNYIHRLCKYEGIRSQGHHYQWKKPGEERCQYNNLVWDGWGKLTRPREVVVSDMTAFYVNKTYYELTLYFDAWNKEILGYGLTTRKGDVNTYYDGLNHMIDNIKKEKTDEMITLHTDQGSVYSSKLYNELLSHYNIQHSMSRAGTPTDNPVNESLNGWIKEELFIDFDIRNSKDVPKLIDEYVYYFNYCRPSYALNYKTPIQFKIESGF